MVDPDVVSLDPFQNIIEVGWGGLFALTCGGLNSAYGTVAHVPGFTVDFEESTHDLALIFPGITAPGGFKESKTFSVPDGFPNAPGPPGTIDGPTEEFFLSHIMDREPPPPPPAPQVPGPFKWTYAYQRIRSSSDVGSALGAEANTQFGLWANLALVKPDGQIVPAVVRVKLSAPRGSGDVTSTTLYASLSKMTFDQVSGQWTHEEVPDSNIMVGSKPTASKLEFDIQGGKIKNVFMS